MTTSGRNRSRAARLAATAVAVGLLVATAGATGSGAGVVSGGGEPDRAWSGFRIDTGPGAVGSWLGARRLGGVPGRVVYRIDPAADPRSGGFGALRRMTKILGPGLRRSAGQGATARAAWILSKYGAYRYEIQSAAVDAAVLDLLASREHRLRGRASRARLRETGVAPEIRRFAAIMLRDSKRRSGPYRVALRQVGRPAVGDAVQLSALVVGSRSGAPLASVPVRIRVDGGPWQEAAETDPTGRVSLAYAGRVAGPHVVTVRVGRVPEHRLLVLQPRRARASRVVVAGRKHAITGEANVIVQARPIAHLRATSISADNRTVGTLRLSDAYGSAPTAAAVVLRGPFGSRAQATCDRKALRVRRLTVAGNGTYALPRLRLRTTGFYRWQVAITGDAYNLAATDCGGTFRVRARS